jgi:hypothetical protein
MTDVALMMLMAGIAASHLRMHHQESNDHDDCNDHDDGPSSDGEGGSPWTMLVNPVASAADLVLVRGGLMTDNHCNNDNVCAAVIGGGDGASNNVLEGSLLMLNEETARGWALTVPNGEVERWNVVMHSFRIALKVAGLAMGRLILTAVNAIGALSPFLVFFFLLLQLQLSDAHNDVQLLSELQKRLTGWKERVIQGGLSRDTDGRVAMGGGTTCRHAAMMTNGVCCCLLLCHPRWRRRTSTS